MQGGAIIVRVYGERNHVHHTRSLSNVSCLLLRYSIMKSCWHWSEDSRPLPRELRLRLDAAIRTADDKAVLQVPELVVPDLYATVAGISVDSLSYNYSVL